jgi:hypothetical protein
MRKIFASPSPEARVPTFVFLTLVFSCVGVLTATLREYGLGRFYRTLLQDQDTYRGLNESAACN